MPTIDNEFMDCLDVLYEILSELKKIEIFLKRKQNPSTILSPPFDPMQTIGKYC